MGDEVHERAGGKPSWRIRVGTWMFAVPFVMFVGAPVVVPFLGLSAGDAAAVIGGVIVAAEVIWFASIPLLGKEGFAEMKKKSFSFLKLPSGPVSQPRHKLGVRLFWLGLGGQLGLHAVLAAAIVIVGGHPENGRRAPLQRNGRQFETLWFESVLLDGFAVQPLPECV